MNEPQNNFDILRNKLEQIRVRGPVPCTRQNNRDGGIGNTLEDLLNIRENNLQIPDYLEYEIKSQRVDTTSPITLFSIATENRNNRRLFDKYGQTTNDNTRRLYWTVYMGRLACLYGRYECQLEFDNLITPQRLYVKIKDTITNNIDTQAYWDLQHVREIANNKIRNLVACHAQTINSGNNRYFQYKNFNCYFNFSFDKLLDCIRDGLVQVDFRIGADLTGNHAGKYHDHGSAFRIQGIHLYKLYERVKNF